MGDDLNDYQRAINALFARTTGKSKFGLERTEAFLDALGKPHLRMPVLHIAGTNGKGSVCATLETLLRAQGHRVAKYTSPHLVDFRERFILNGLPISEDYVVEFIDTWMPEIENIGATFFEATTAMAFAWFAEQRATIAVIEAGLGGRLDSTNVVHPMVAAVATIGIDHVEQLGTTHEAIAHEKGGIFKPGVAAIVGEPDATIASLLVSQAVDAGSTPVIDVWRTRPPRNIEVSAAGTRFTIDTPEGPLSGATALAGMHQASNAVLALEVLNTAGDAFWPGWRSSLDLLANVRLPGRFHRVGRWVFDVAHNPDGVHVLKLTLKKVMAPRPIVAVVCVLGDKDWRSMLRELSGAVDELVLTNAPTAPESRSWDLQEAADFARAEGWKISVESDFDNALRIGTERGATTLVTGSFHTVGDAMSRLQVNPLAE